jgi:hypothetical protein
MKIIFNIATIGDRPESLNKVLESLNNQTIKIDEINIYDNSKEDIDLDAKGKFYFLQFYNEPVYYFTGDDDIYYPPTYIKDMILAIDKYKCIVTHHGRRLLGENRKYYQGHKAFKFSSTNKHEIFIDVAGTGVTAFSTDYFNPIDLIDKSQRRMVDLLFSLEAAKVDKDIMLLKHTTGYFKPLQLLFKQNDSCFTSGYRSTQRDQIILANEIYKIKNQKKATKKD